MTYEEYTQLAQELSKKVNLFGEVWRDNPETRIYGGSTRDYLLWVKRQFKDVKSRAEADTVIKNLRERPIIELKEFLTPQSDIDLIGNLNKQLSAEQYGISRIDLHPSGYLASVNEAFIDEVRQGFLPAEKIQLNAKGFITLKEFGNGIQEIYEGKLSVHMTPQEIFKTTHWAQKGLNHQILLSLRYIRLLSSHAFSEFGQDAVEINKILANIDPVSRASIESVINRCLDGHELKSFLHQDLFKKWMNGTIQKSFSTYTNRSVAFALLKQFRVDELTKIYPGIEPYNHYLVTRPKDTQAIKKFLLSHNMTPERLYDPVSSYFRDGHMYHGTSSEDSFRAIILQGILGSKLGAAGSGVYGVAEGNIAAAISEGGRKENLLKFKVRPGAKIVDITRGQGYRLYIELNLSHDEFAEKVGADILKYPYEYGEAFVVKNPAVLEKAEGVYRTIRTYAEVATKFSSIRNLEDKYNLLKEAKLSQFEIETLLGQHSDFKLQFAIELTKNHSLAKEIRINTPPAKYLDITSKLAQAVTEGHVSIQDMAGFFNRDQDQHFEKSKIYDQITQRRVSAELKANTLEFLTGQVNPNWKDPANFQHALKQIATQTNGYDVNPAYYYNKFIQMTPEAVIGFLNSKQDTWAKVAFEKVVFPQHAARLGREFLRELILNHPSSHASLAVFFALPKSRSFSSEFALLAEQSRDIAITLVNEKAFENFKNQSIDAAIRSTIKWLSGTGQSGLLSKIFSMPEISRNTQLTVEYVNSLHKAYPHDSILSDALKATLSSTPLEQSKLLLRRLLETGSSDLTKEVEGILKGKNYSFDQKTYTSPEFDIFRKAIELPTNIERQNFFAEHMGAPRSAPMSCRSLFL